uniref:LolCTLd n=1 Tax=Bichromomyia olmeca TaxID=715919 RepID=A0A1B1V3F8_9DIPT|nr:LolCTLd [Bichromomyia olmeca]
MALRFFSLLITCYLINLCSADLNAAEHITGKTVLVSKVKKNWNDAKNFCKTKGYNLAMTKTKQEQYELSIIIEKWTLEQHIWVGGHKDAKDNDFKWNDDGKLVAKEKTQNTFANWAKGKPGNPKGEACMELEFNKSKNIYGEWNSADCSKQHIFVCEKRSA